MGSVSKGLSGRKLLGCGDLVMLLPLEERLVFGSQWPDFPDILGFCDALALWVGLGFGVLVGLKSLVFLGSGHGEPLGGVRVFGVLEA